MVRGPLCSSQLTLHNAGDCTKKIDDMTRCLIPVLRTHTYLPLDRLLIWYISVCRCPIPIRVAVLYFSSISIYMIYVAFFF